MNRDQLFRQVFVVGRTHRAFIKRQVHDSLLVRLYNLAKFGPSASNLCPMRITFVKSAAQKQKVIAAAAEGNKPKIESAPVVAIIAHDTTFYNHIEKLAPHMDADAFRGQEKAKLEQIALRIAGFRLGFLSLQRGHSALTVVR